MMHTSDALGAYGLNKWDEMKVIGCLQIFKIVILLLLKERNFIEMLFVFFRNLNVPRDGA